MPQLLALSEHPYLNDDPEAAKHLADQPGVYFLPCGSGSLGESSVSTGDEGSKGATSSAAAPLAPLLAALGINRLSAALRRSLHAFGDGGAPIADRCEDGEGGEDVPVAPHPLLPPLAAALPLLQRHLRHSLPAEAYAALSRSLPPLLAALCLQSAASVVATYSLPLADGRVASVDVPIASGLDLPSRRLLLRPDAGQRLREVGAEVARLFTDGRSHAGLAQVRPSAFSTVFAAVV